MQGFVKLKMESRLHNKIICIGRNYVEHIKELKNEMPSEAVYFMKPFSSISEEIKVVDYSPMHYEGEICFLMGEKIKVGFGFDFTLREIQMNLKKRGFLGRGLRLLREVQYLVSL